MIKIGTALFEACEELERERGISKEVLIASLCDAMVAAYKKHMHVKEAANIEAILQEYYRVLAPLAYVLRLLVPGLYLYPPGRQPGGEGKMGL